LPDILFDQIDKDIESFLQEPFEKSCDSTKVQLDSSEIDEINVSFKILYFNKKYILKNIQRLIFYSNIILS
jgi:hypothetical protein